MTRALALLLAVFGGAVAALVAVMFGTAVLFGMLWLYVFGDDRWPWWVETFLDITVPMIGLFLWGMFGWQIWQRVSRDL